jgi:hypothetical protein
MDFPGGETFKQGNADKVKRKPPSLRRHYPVQVLRVSSQPIQKESAPRELVKQPVYRLFHEQIYDNIIQEKRMGENIPVQATPAGCFRKN